MLSWSTVQVSDWIWQSLQWHSWYQTDQTNNFNRFDTLSCFFIYRAETPLVKEKASRWCNSFEYCRDCTSFVLFRIAENSFRDHHLQNLDPIRCDMSVVQQLLLTGRCNPRASHFWRIWYFDDILTSDFDQYLGQFARVMEAEQVPCGSEAKPCWDSDLPIDSYFWFYGSWQIAGDYHCCCRSH